MKALGWDDNWIIEHLDEFDGWAKMVAEYNKVFGTSFTRVQLKNHAGVGGKLGLTCNGVYTDDENNWLRDNFPNYDCKTLVELYNKKFGRHRTEHSLHVHCNETLGLEMDVELKLQRARESQLNAIAYRRSNVGTIGRPSNGYLMIKTDDGWKPYARHILEQQGIEIGDDEQVVFLDGDKTNYAVDNIAKIPRKVAPLLSKNHMFSSDPNITKVAITWAELYSVLSERDIISVVEE